MESLSRLLSVAVSYAWGWPLIILCLGAGIYFTIRFGAIQISGFLHALRIVKGDYDNPEDKGEISHLQALSAALSATIGLGNIAGVAVAIKSGGPGAVFWMWVVATFGMATKYTTCLLSNRYRKVFEDGSVRGGPMYFIERGLGDSFKFLAVLFAIFCTFASFGGGNMFQSNQVGEVLNGYFHIPKVLTGAVLSVLVALVIIGGIKRIGKVAEKIVPFMCIVYILGGTYVILTHIDQLPALFSLIFSDAFTNAIHKAGAGSFGYVLGSALKHGVRRAVFSNEAGLGSAPIAHAAAKTDEPVREGLVAMLGPFIDTIVVCTMTALVIIITGTYKNSGDLVIYSLDRDKQKLTEVKTIHLREKVVKVLPTDWLDDSYLMLTDKDKYRCIDLYQKDRLYTFYCSERIQDFALAGLDNDSGLELAVSEGSLIKIFKFHKNRERWYLENKKSLFFSASIIKILTHPRFNGAFILLDDEKSMYLIRNNGIRRIELVTRFSDGALFARKDGLFSLILVESDDPKKAVIRHLKPDGTLINVYSTELIAPSGRFLVHPSLGLYAQKDSRLWSFDEKAGIFRALDINLKTASTGFSFDGKVYGILPLDGVRLTAFSFDQAISGFGKYFVALAVILFAYSTMISWSYYGETGAFYLFGRSAVLPYKIIYVIAIFTGSIWQLTPIVDFSDTMFAMMAVPNIIAAMLLSSQVKRLTSDYFRRLKDGTIKIYKDAG